MATNFRPLDTSSRRFADSIAMMQSPRLNSPTAGRIRREPPVKNGWRDVLADPARPPTHTEQSKRSPLTPIGCGLSHHQRSWWDAPSEDWKEAYSRDELILWQTEPLASCRPAQRFAARVPRIGSKLDRCGRNLSSRSRAAMTPHMRDYEWSKALE